jgi:hypothetical protein
MFISDDVFRLRPGSPCIDAGDSNLVPVGSTLDLAGQTRFRDDPYTVDTGVGTAPIVDIGAYEFVQTARFGFVNGKKNVRLTLKDAGNNNVTFSLSGTGFGATDPCDPTFEIIDIYNNNDDADKAALAISTKAKAGSSLGSILCLGPMKSIRAGNIDLNGEIIIGSAFTPGAAVTMAFGAAENLTINSEMPVKSITTTDWWNGSLTAPSVGGITARGDKGRGMWGDLFIDVKTGDIGTVKAAGEIGGTWNCKSVKSITCRDTDAFYLMLSQKSDPRKQALGKLSVKGCIDWSHVVSSGNIGTITAGEVWCSNFFAGVSDTCITKDDNTDDVLDLPTADAANFPENATIKSIAVKGVKGRKPPFFVNSNIAATNVLNISLIYPYNDNGGEPFGITADYIKSLKIKDVVGTMSLKNLHVPANITDPPEGDAQIRLY